MATEKVASFFTMPATAPFLFHSSVTRQPRPASLLAKLISLEKPYAPILLLRWPTVVEFMDLIHLALTLLSQTPILPILKKLSALALSALPVL
jgi:hypothetical protein